MSDALPSEGWYPDAEDQRLIRWWDGNRWTDQTRDAPGYSRDPQPLPVIPEPAVPTVVRPEEDDRETLRRRRPASDRYQTQVEEEQPLRATTRMQMEVDPPSAFTPVDSPDQGAAIISERSRDPKNDLIASLGYVFAVIAPPVGLGAAALLLFRKDDRALYVLGVSVLFLIIGILFFL